MYNTETTNQILETEFRWWYQISHCIELTIRALAPLRRSLRQRPPRLDGDRKLTRKTDLTRTPIFSFLESIGNEQKRAGKHQERQKRVPSMCSLSESGDDWWKYSPTQAFGIGICHWISVFGWLVGLLSCFTVPDTFWTESTEITLTLFARSPSSVSQDALLWFSF